MESRANVMVATCLVIFLITFGCGGSGDDAGGDYEVSGLVQKGPFISGSSITIQELDDNLESTGVSYETTTTDDFGTFSIGSQIGTRYVEIIATGFYYNEVFGGLSPANLTLRAISDLATEAVVNVNILTTLEKDRVKYLMTNDGLSFSEARSQAETEILEIFGIHEESFSNFSQMDISQPGDDNAILLAISAILQRTAYDWLGTPVAELSELISKINLDIKSDGVLDDATCLEELRYGAEILNLEEVRQYMEERYASLGLSVSIPDFELFVDSDNDGSLNIDDDDITLYKPENAAASGGHQKATIVWDSVEEAVGYNIYWSTTSGVSKKHYDGVIYHNETELVWSDEFGYHVDTPTTEHLHEGLTDGTTYYYVVTGVNSGGFESLESDELAATPSPAEGTPENPYYLGKLSEWEGTYVNYQGYVDSSASYYRVDSDGWNWVICLKDLSQDVDLYVYEDAEFSELYDSSTQTGTTGETCNIKASATNYIKVTGSPATADGTGFTIYSQDAM